MRPRGKGEARKADQGISSDLLRVTAEFMSDNSQYWEKGRVGARINGNWSKWKKNG